MLMLHTDRQRHYYELALRMCRSSVVISLSQRLHYEELPLNIPLKEASIYQFLSGKQSLTIRLAKYMYSV